MSAPSGIRRQLLCHLYRTLCTGSLGSQEDFLVVDGGGSRLARPMGLNGKVGYPSINDPDLVAENAYACAYRWPLTFTMNGVGCDNPFLRATPLDCSYTLVNQECTNPSISSLVRMLTTVLLTLPAFDSIGVFTTELPIFGMVFEK